MAIYYFNASVISRSAGRSATASAAYRAAEKIKDERTGEIHDYRKKKGVDEKLILAPDSAPSWVQNRQQLWNEVERVEYRINSQLAREIQLAIPVELNRNQQIELVKEYAADLFVKEGMIADVAFHELDSHNPHAHIMLTMREIDEHGFKKNNNRDWNKRQLLEKQREVWSAYANVALEKAGINERIDHRTLEEQGINRIPQIHLGSAVTAMMKRGVATDKGDLAEIRVAVRWLEIAEKNKQIERKERSLITVEKEIAAEKKLNPTPSTKVDEELELNIMDSALTNESDLLPSTDTEPEVIEEFVSRQQQEEIIRIASKFLHLAGVNVWSREGGKYHLMSNQKNLLVITAQDERGEILRYEDGKITTQGLTSFDVEKFAQVDAWLDQKVEEIQARELTRSRQQEPELGL